jgi:large subunit ribosomal protein L35
MPAKVSFYGWNDLLSHETAVTLLDVRHLPNLNRQAKSMPKMKTHKGAAKRFKMTGSGKIVRHHAFARHILTSKSPSRKRHLGTSTVMDPADAPKVKVMLPYGL